MKKNIILCITIFFVFSLSINQCYANDDEINVLINGKQITFDVAPTTINDRTMVPLRQIFESLGAEVNWDESSQTITATRNNDTIILIIDSTVASVNGVNRILDVPATIVNDRTLVPLRFISESLNANVEWIEETSTVKITYSPSETPTPTSTSATEPTPSDSPKPTESPKVEQSASLSKDYYVCKDGRFKIKLPEGWSASPMYMPDNTMVVVFNPPNDENIFFSVVCDTQAKNYTLQQAAKEFLDGYMLAGFKSEGLTETKRQNIKVGTQDAKWFELEGLINNKQTKQFGVFTANNETVHMAFVILQDKDIAKYESVLTESIKSFEAIN